MSSDMYINSRAVKAFFKMLEDSAIEYVLIKNIGGELPDRLKKNKDIDILVSGKELERATALLLENGFKQIPHPYSKETGWLFAYGASDCYKFIRKEDGLDVDIFCELCLKSLMGNIWVPMDKSINEKVWNDKLWDENNKWWITDDETQLVYMISRCVFDKRIFSPVYIEEINSRSHLLTSHTIQDMLEKVFFKFTGTLVEMVANGRYDTVISEYLAFRAY